MPELPEVEIVKRGLEAAILGKKLVQIDQRRKDLRIPFPENLAARLKDMRVESLQRRGKYIWVHLSSHDILVFHLGMSGRMLILSAHDSLTAGPHDHLILTLEDGGVVVFQDPRRFGMVMLVAEDGIEQHKSFSAMGPEPLGNGFHADMLAAALAGRSMAIKAALLDQRIVAGIGNIYASEALYMAGIDPQRPAGALSIDECESLCRAVKEVLKKAIKAGGSTLKDYRHTDGNLGYFQHSFSVYDREGQPCPDCDCDVKMTGGIKNIKQSGRSTYYCPQRQS